jgi:hypothetical protein
MKAPVCSLVSYLSLLLCLILFFHLYNLSFVSPWLSTQPSPLETNLALSSGPGSTLLITSSWCTVA